MALYVCSGAKLKCSMGSQESELAVIHPVRPVRIKGKPMAAMMDHKPMVNIKPFGQCQSLANPTVAAATAANYGRLQKMPCIPNTTMPWTGVKMNVRVKGQSALLDSSKLMCMWAGVIEITNPGQDFVQEERHSLRPIAGAAQMQGETADVVGEEINREETSRLTIKDFAEILVKIEQKKGCYEAARHYAAYHADYWTLTNLARRYVDETDEEKREAERDNDPNLMPSRFMLLYGADDDKLREAGHLDLHHDDFANPAEHEVSVANLRKALKLLGYDVADSGQFDQQLFHAFLLYLNRFNCVELPGVYEDETDAERPLEDAADKYGLATWKCLYDKECSNGDGSVDHAKLMKKLNCDYGDELVAAKGGDPNAYRSSICYHYPWVPFSLTVEVDDGYQENEDAIYEIYDRNKLTLLAEGPFRKPYTIERLLPDSNDILVYANGAEICLNPEPPTAVHIADGEENTEPRIVKMYWSYWNGERYIEIEDDLRSKYYNDLNFHVETKNYYDGDKIEVTIENENGLPLFDDIVQFGLIGTVYNNKVVLKNVLNRLYAKSLSCRIGINMTIVATVGELSARVIIARSRWEDVYRSYTALKDRKPEPTSNVALLSHVLSSVMGGNIDECDTAQKLKDWLSKSDIWRDADVEVSASGRNGFTAVREQILKWSRNTRVYHGIYIVIGDNGNGHAALWIDYGIEHGRNMIGERDNIRNGDTVYFWGLKCALRTGLEAVRSDNIDDAAMAAARVMLPRAKDRVEYSATICKQGDDYVIGKGTIREGTETSVMLVDCICRCHAGNCTCHTTRTDQGFRCTANCGGEPKAYIHTHGILNSSELSADDLYVSLTRKMPVYLVNKDGFLIGREFEEGKNTFENPLQISHSNTPETKDINYIRGLHAKMNNSNIPESERKNAEEELLIYLSYNSIAIPEREDNGIVIQEENL